MAPASGTQIELARGPYLVTAENAAQQASMMSFRHYKPEELEMSREFVAQGKILGTWYLDVYLETPRSREILSSMSPTTAGEAVPWMNRIDAVVLEGAATDIIEFKLALRPTGIGELVTYREQYASQYNPAGPIFLEYVVKYDRPEHHPALEAQGIRLWIV
jgi:hypothetical protein